MGLDLVPGLLEMDLTQLSHVPPLLFALASFLSSCFPTFKPSSDYIDT